MKILFLHGYGSDPNGIRPMYLKESGYEVIHPALPDEDFDESLRIAQKAFDHEQPDVVVGSSRGGAVAMNIDTGNTPLVLIAPAWKTRGPVTTVKAAVTILHSANDDVVPIENSRQLLNNSGLPEDRLVVVGEDHRMTDKAAFGALLDAVSPHSRGARPDPPEGAQGGPGQGGGRRSGRRRAGEGAHHQ